jgi:hypothetical protein
VTPLQAASNLINAPLIPYDWSRDEFMAAVRLLARTVLEAPHSRYCNVWPQSEAERTVNSPPCNCSLDSEKKP